MQWVEQEDPKRVQVRLALLERALTVSDPRGWRLLGHTLINCGETGRAVDRMTEAVALLPTDLELRQLLVWALRREDRDEDALAAAEDALASIADDGRLEKERLQLLALLKRIKRRDVESEAATPYLASSPQLLGARVRSLPHEEAIALCDRIFESDPEHTYARYLKALALAKLGRAAEACAIIDPARDIEISELPVPPDFEDGDTFRAALAREIKANPTLRADPRGRTTRQGRQTRRLQQPGAHAVDALIGQIRLAVERYAESRDSKSDVRACQPGRVDLSIWAVVYDRDGRQLSHCHPDGWVSGVYYVNAPRPGGDNRYRGPLLLGELLKEDGIDPPWGVHEIEPVPGRLVIFPSYVPHATAPTGVDGERISVAFDVMRVQLR